MSIAEKLVTVAENVPKVFNAGQLSVISQSEALKGFASGEVISIKDISPVEHNVKCFVSSDTIQDLSSVKIKRLGKNLFDYTKPKYSGYVQPISQENNAIILPAQSGSYLSANFPIENQESLLGKTITASCYVKNPTPSQAYFALYIMTGNTGSFLVGKVINANKEGIAIIKYTIPNSISQGQQLCLNLYGNTAPVSSASGRIEYRNIQIEIGSTATEYEPYIEHIEYTANADGTVDGIKSLYPSMTLTSDTEGVIVTAEYIKDIDKAFDERLAEIEKALVNN